MTGNASAEPGRKGPHDVVLTSGSDIIGLKLCDGQGNHLPFGFERPPVPRSSMRISQGQGRYSDLEPPWLETAQSDWSGGKGNKDYDRDQSMYYDGDRVNTTRPGEIILAGAATSIGDDTTSSNTPVGTYGIEEGYGYFAYQFEALASLTVELLVLTLTCACETYAGLATISGGEPDTVTMSSNYFEATDTPTGPEALVFELSSSVAIVDGTDYCLVIQTVSPF